jgi:SAM-dependent methyltransferase
LNYLALIERRELVELGGKGRHEPGSSDDLIDYDRVADVYDLYVTSDLDVGFYVEEATKARGKVLELMCGTGRVSVPLLEAGVDLTCVDVSAGMLRHLEERLHAHKLDARVVRADIRHLDLGGEEEFELALIPFHSFSELLTPRDQELAMRAVFGCLREGAWSARFTTRLSEPDRPTALSD